MGPRQRPIWKIETGPLSPLPGEIVGAAPDGEDPADDAERATHRGDIGERAEIAGAGDVPSARHQHPRKRLLQCHHDAGVTLVILEPDVESRLVLLDERVLEQERLRLVRDDDGLDVGDELAEPRVLDAAGLVAGEVAAHPRPQVLRLADVEDLPVGVFPEINAGTRR
jgi:hypothetical protein